MGTAERAKFDVALVAVLSDAGFRRSEAAALTRGAVVAITTGRMAESAAIRPVVVGGDEKVFGLSESQIARRVKTIAKAVGIAEWELFNGHSGRDGMVGRYTRGESAGSALRYLWERTSSITVALELRATARVSGNGFQGSDFVPPAPTAVAIYAGQCSHKVVTATCITAA